MIRLHNYNDLKKRKGELELQKKWFYDKYFTKEEDVLLDLITPEDFPKWDTVDKELFEVNELIDDYVRNAKKGGWNFFGWLFCW